MLINVHLRGVIAIIIAIISKVEPKVKKKRRNFIEMARGSLLTRRGRDNKMENRIRRGKGPDERRKNMAKDKKVEQITDMEKDFAQWFTDVCKIGRAHV